MCRLSTNAQTLHASEQMQRHLQQQLAACQGELEAATARADTAHSEALTYLSKARQQDRQVDMDRLMSASVSVTCLMADSHACISNIQAKICKISVRCIVILLSSITEW